MIPVYSVSNLLAAKYFTKSIYFELVGNAYAAIGLASFFNLLYAYVTEGAQDPKQYFRRLKLKHWQWPLSWFRKGKGYSEPLVKTPRNGLTWFNVSSMFDLQTTRSLTRLDLLLRRVSVQFRAPSKLHCRIYCQCFPSILPCIAKPSTRLHLGLSSNIQDLAPLIIPGTHHQCNLSHSILILPNTISSTGAARFR